MKPRAYMTVAVAAAFLASFVAEAAAIDTLRDFVRDVKSGRAHFTQTVTSPDGAKKKTSSGSFEFSRPNRFRFVYVKPFEQTIVADGEKVWIYDADLNQVSSRKFSSALGATPAALLAGGSLDKDFDLSSLPSHDGLDWAEARPKAKDGAFQSVQVGFKGKELAALEIVDSFGQKSLLTFSAFAPNVALPADSFRFTPPAGADVIEQ
ncbi:MAG: outer membrane lipoprotein chaperone LolA [Pseudomonadota bacterium]|nr:outer membrane lipoprotein chaperone LolA [Pseudomonadota bacterium]